MPNFLLKSFFAIFIILTAQYSFAQSWQFGLKGGLSLPNLASTGSSEISKGYTSISGPDFELFADYRLNEKFSIETGMEWSTQGGQKTGLQTIPAIPELIPYFPPGSDANYLYANFTSTVRLQYLMLPILLKYTIPLDHTDHWKLYMDGGVFGALLMTASASASGSSKVYFDKEETQQVGSVTVKFDSTGNIKNQLHNGNFGIAGNIGLLYQLATTSFFAEGGGNFGFVHLQKNHENGINQTGALLFRVGFQFRFEPHN